MLKHFLLKYNHYYLYLINQQELDYLFKFSNLEEEKAKYEASINDGGSILDIAGSVQVTKAPKPKTIGEKLALMKEQRLQEIKEKRNRRR